MISSPLYGAKTSEYFSSARSDYVDALPADPTARILELGCGSGGTGALALAKGKCATFVGVELVAEQASLAAERISRVWQGDIEALDLPYDDATFDALICSEVLEHLTDPWKTVSRLVRLLKPGALVFASSPNISHVRVLASLIMGRFEYRDSGVMDRTHLRWFTPSSFRRLFEQAGVVVDSMTALTTNPLVRRVPPWVPFAYLAWSQIDLRGRRAAEGAFESWA